MTTFPSKIKWKIINSKNASYDFDWCSRLQYLYEGGISMQKHAALFLPKEQVRCENDRMYKERIKCVAYRPYFSTIINDFNSELFSKSFSILPAADASDKSTMGEDTESDFYKEFSRNADLQDHNLTYVFSQLVKRAQITKRAYLGIDFPKPNQEVISLAEQEASGQDRAYVFEIDTLNVIDWECDDLGRYSRVILKNETVPRPDLTSARDKRYFTFKVWEKEPNKKPVFAVYQLVKPIDEPPQETDECILIDQGSVSFPEIPILCLDLPDHLWIGGLIGQMAVEHFRRNSELTWSKKRNLFSAPIIFKGPELPGNGDLNSTQGDETRDSPAIADLRSKNIAVLGAGDRMEFAEPDGTVYTIEEQSLEKLVDAMHAIVGLKGRTVTAMSKMQGESGLAKMVDNHAKEQILASYANVVKDFGPKLFHLISQARGENILWRVVGMENWAYVDSQDALTEALQLNQIPIPSKTLKKHLFNNSALKLAGDIPAETQNVIKKEIDQAVDALPDDQIVPPSPAEQFQASMDAKKDTE